jgi:SurA-like N-terminal domain
VTTRIPALVAAFAVLGGALTACGSGPSQANAAVIFGDRVISVDDVQHRLDKALQEEPATKELAKNHKLDLVSRGIVNQLIRHELLAEAARREGLTVSEKDLTDLTTRIAPSDDPVVRSVQAAFDRKEIVRDRVLAVELGQKRLTKEQLVLNGVVIGGAAGTRAKAVELGKTIAAAPDKASSLGEQAVGADGRGQPLKDFQFNAIRTYEGAKQQSQGQPIPVDAMTPPLFSAPDNAVVVLSLGSGGEEANPGFLVALVRRPASGVPGEEASFASDVPVDWLEALGEHVTASYAKELSFRISPRYGVWDELAVGVAPSDAEKIGQVLPVTTARQ